MFDLIVKELESRYGLAGKARPFAQMLLAAMTDSEQGGVGGFVQRLRNLGGDWGSLLDSWLNPNSGTPRMLSSAQVEQAFGGSGGLLAAMTNKLGVARDVLLRALPYAIPALLGKLSAGGRLLGTLPGEVANFIGDRRQWSLAPAVAAAPATASKGFGWMPWLLAAVVAALLLGYCAMKSGTAPAPQAKAPAAPVATVAPPSGAAPTAAAQASEEPAGAGYMFSMVDSLPLLKVYFDSGKTDVAPEFPAKAAGLIDYLKANADKRVGISGFNDPTGDPVKNAELSKNRAKAVQAALVAAGVPVERTELVKPAEATGTAATNAASRRVEVSILK